MWLPLALAQIAAIINNRLRGESDKPVMPHEFLASWRLPRLSSALREEAAAAEAAADSAAAAALLERAAAIPGVVVSETKKGADL